MGNTQYSKFFETLKNQLHDQDVEKDFGSGSVVGSTRFGSGGHYQRAPAPPTSRKEQAYEKVWRAAEELVKQGKFKTKEQAFVHLLSNSPKFRYLIEKDYYGWHQDDDDDEVIDALAVLEKEYVEPLDVAIERGLSDFSEHMSYEQKLSELFKANPELELRWFYQR